MSKNRGDELSNSSTTSEVSPLDRDGLYSRSLSGSFTRSRRNSRIATVKPVTKCLSSSEEDIAKADKLAQKGSASPRIAKLLSKDMTSMDKDVIVAELEKCLAELENNDNPYSTLTDEYKRMEVERDELATELENAFEDLEGYMHHVHDIEAALKSSEAERDELAKEVEYLKYCLTHRQEVEKNSLKLGKETLETQLKEVREENMKMTEQVSELLSERESLIQSLLNLHSSEVDDVIQSRSRSCSVVSIESSSSSLLRSEHAELKERVEEAEEAELKMSEELQKCKGDLEKTLKEKAELEKCIKDMKVEISEMEEDEMNFKERLDELKKERKEELKAKDKEINEMKMEIATLRKENENWLIKDENASRKSEFAGKATAELVKALEEEKSRLSKELCSVKDDYEKYKSKEADVRKEFDELKSRSYGDAESLRNMTREFEESQANFKKVKDEKIAIEKQMAEVGEKLLNERAKARMEKMNFEKTVEKLNQELNIEKERNTKLEKQRSSGDELNEKIVNLTDENEENKKEVRKLKMEIKKQKEEIVAEKGNFKKKEIDLIQTEKELSEAKEKVSSLKNELRQTSNSQKELKFEKGRIEKEIEELKSKTVGEKESISKENASLKVKIENLEREMENMKKSEKELFKVKESLSKKELYQEKVEAEKQELSENLREEKQRSLKDREKLENELQTTVQNLNRLKEKLDSEHNNADKVLKLESKIHELERLISNSSKEKAHIENKFLLQIRELSSSHEKEIKELKDVSQSRLESEENHQRQIAHLKSKVEDLNIFIERAETKVREQELDLKNTKKELAESEKHVASLRQEKSAMQLEIGRLRAETVSLNTDLDRVSKQFRNSCADVEKALSEKKLIKEQLEHSKLELESLNTMKKVSAESDQKLMSEKIDEHLKNHEVLRVELQSEISRLKQEQRAIEVDLMTTKNHLEQARDKELKFRHSIDGLSENIERLRREKSQLEKALELSDAEKKELSEKLRKVTQASNIRGYDETLAENDELRRQCNSLQDELEKAHGNNKTLVDKLRKGDEANASNMRSLKARKSELQIQLVDVQHEKEDLEKEVRVLKLKIASLKSESDSRDAHRQIENEAVQKLEAQVKSLGENLEAAESRIKSLEEGNEEYKEKLHESEELILDLQKAVARANDVAMEKALESSRHKRLFEKRFEKILKENFHLQKQLYFDGPSVDHDRSNHGRSLSELTSQTNSRQLNDRSDGFMDDVKATFDYQPQRKQSAGELISSRGIERERQASLWRSNSAASAQRDVDMKPIRTKVTVGSVTPPVRYTSDTDSIGSRPDSNDGDFAPSSPGVQKSFPPTYQDTNKEKEDERQNAIPQPNRIHRPILLKEIKLPNLSPAEERKNLSLSSPKNRSPVSRSPGMRRKQEKKTPVVERDANVQERMEHWV